MDELIERLEVSAAKVGASGAATLLRQAAAELRRVRESPVRECVDAVADTMVIDLEAGDVAEWAGAGLMYRLVPERGEVEG